MLAGGAGQRLLYGAAAKLPPFRVEGGHPALREPLVAYPLGALAEVCGRLAVVCKRQAALPEIGPAERWEEPEEPRHPLTGLVHALERAQAPVVVCAVDMPFVTPEALRAGRGRHRG